MLVAVDYETRYNDTVSVSTMGLRRYPHFGEAYLVAIAWEDNLYSGHPSKAPWGEVAGGEWVSHNAPFDQAVHFAADYPMPKQGWYCSMSASRCLGGPGNLKDAAKFWVDMDLSKEVRNRMKGVVLDDLSAFEQTAVVNYAAEDAKACLALWRKLRPLLHEWDLRSIAHANLMALRGVCVDEALLKSYDTSLREAQMDHMRRWEKEGWGDLTKAKTVARLCAKHGIPKPNSTNRKDADYVAWQEEHAKDAEFVRDLQTFRSSTRTRGVVGAIANRVWKGRVDIPVSYFGTITGRFNCKNPNLFNLPRSGAYNLRKLLVASPGKTLALCDYSQVEPRVLYWLAGETYHLDALRKGMCPYEAFARQALGYRLPEPLALAAEKDKKAAGLRHLAKACVLGAGYGAWWPTFKEQSKIQMGLELSDEEAKKAILSYRDNNPKVVAFWKQCQIQILLNHGKDMTVKLPGWRTLYYRQMRMEGRKPDHPLDLNLASQLAKDHCDCTYLSWGKGGGHRRKIYGAKLVENIVQSVANMILLEGAWKIEAQRIGQVLWHVYDENVVEIDKPERAQDVLRVMNETEDWRTDLPLATSLKLSDHYTK